MIHHESSSLNHHQSMHESSKNQHQTIIINHDDYDNQHHHRMFCRSWSYKGIRSASRRHGDMNVLLILVRLVTLSQRAIAGKKYDRDACSNPAAHWRYKLNPSVRGRVML